MRLVYWLVHIIPKLTLSLLLNSTIRQQLTNTEDIRRVRKKAPCTRPEISMIQKQYLEDEIFLEPLFTGKFLMPLYYLLLLNYILLKFTNFDFYIFVIFDYLPAVPLHIFF